MAYPSKRVLKICVVCKVEFSCKESQDKSGRRFCSKICSYKGMIGHRPYHYKGGRFVHRGYVYILVKGHPSSDRDGYVLEHRIVMERKIGRYLSKNEVVHHKNRQKNDNRIENLELLTTNEHNSLHHPKGERMYRGEHPRLGAKHSEETKLKMREAWRKRKIKEGLVSLSKEIH